MSDLVGLCGDNKLANAYTNLLGFNPKGDHHIALANGWVLLTHLVAQSSLTIKPSGLLLSIKK